MPNYIRNRVFAAPHVLDSLAGADRPVDFESVLPKPAGLFDGDVSSLANDCAEKAFNEPLSNNPLLAGLQASNKAKWSAANLDDQGFEDFIAMCRSKRATGFYHSLDWSREVWGTKWNAGSAERKDDHVQFETAWSTPAPVFIALSAKHPKDEIRVLYADEDWGSNCGTMILRSGEVVERIAGDLGFALDLWDADDEARAEYAQAETD